MGSVFDIDTETPTRRATSKGDRSGDPMATLPRAADPKSSTKPAAKAKKGNSVFDIETDATPTRSTTVESKHHGNLLTGIGHTLGRAAQMTRGVPSGLVALGKDVVKAASHGGGGGFSGVKAPGRSVVSTKNLGHAGQQLVDAKKKGVPFREYVAKDTPAIAGLAEGNIETGRHIAHPTSLVRDLKRDPLGTIVNDAANLSLVLGPLGKLAGHVADTAEAAGNAARAERAGAVARNVSKVARTTEKVASLPAKPFELGARGIAAAAKAGYEGAAAGKAGATIADLMAKAKLDPESRDLKRNVLQPAEQKVSEATGRQVRLGEQIGKHLQGPHEEQALYLVGEGQAAALAKVRAALPTEKFDAFVAEHFKGSVTPDAAHLAADVAEGKAPEAAARIADALKVGREGAGGRVERAKGYVDNGPASRTEQLGHAPLTSVVRQATERLEAKLPRAERSAEMARKRAEAATLRKGDTGADLSAELHGKRPDLKLGAAPSYGMGKRLGSLDTRARVTANIAKSAEGRAESLRTQITRAKATAEHSIAAAPARLRPVLETNRAAVKAMVDHENALRRTGDHYGAGLVNKAAEELPTTLAALKAQGVDPDHFIHVQGGAKPGVAPTGDHLPKVRKARSQKVRTGGQSYERTVRAQTQGEIDEVRSVVSREAAEKVAKMPFATKLGVGPLAEARTAKDAADAGYSLWDPKSVFETRPGRAMSDLDAKLGTGPTDVYVPTHIYDGFKSYFADPKFEQLLRKLYDAPTQGWKTAVLALNPSWNVGNMVGNAVLATFGAGVDPATLASSIGEALKQYKAAGGDWEAVAPRRLFTSGPTHAEFDYLRAPQDQLLQGRSAKVAGKVLGPVKAIARKGYAANEFVDNLGRSAVYIAKKGEGLSDELALRESLRAMGDFSRMTPFERRAIRRVIPFYAWSRHITQLAFRLPVEHPLRVAWTLHVGQEVADDPNMPDYLQGAIPVGKGLLLEPGRFFPFGDAGRAVTDVGGSLNPIIKLLAANLRGVPGHGINAQKGRPYSRPPGTGELDEFGRETPTAPSLAHQLKGLFPQARVADALTGRDKVVRYDTGDPVLTRTGPIPSGRDRNLSLLRFLGVPLDKKSEVERMTAGIAHTKAQAERDRLRYRSRASAKPNR